MSVLGHFLLLVLSGLLIWVCSGVLIEAVAFRFEDPFDHSSNGMTGEPEPTDQPLGVGDGTRADFALANERTDRIELVFDRMLNRDDVARFGLVNFLDQCGESG